MNSQNMLHPERCRPRGVMNTIPGFRALFLSIALFSTSVGAQALGGQVAVADETLRAAEAVGREIYVLDRAASVATDVLSTLRGFRKDRRVKGWITEHEGDSILVTFVGSKGKAPVEALYRTTVSDAGKVTSAPERLDSPVPLDSKQSLQFRARNLGLGNIETRCSNTYNTVVLPRDSDESDWVVYVLPGTTKTDVYPVGGSYRIETDPSATTIKSTRGFARSCIALNGPRDLVAFSLSHLLDPSPTEIHVFVSLLSGRPLFLVTTQNSSMWAIENGAIRFASKLDGKS